jgi:putative flippase GtrA
MAGAVSGFVISAALMALLCSGFGMPVAVATPIATLLLFVWNFALARWAILIET